MIQVSANLIDSVLPLMMTEAVLTLEQKNALRTEIINDPKGFGYSTKTVPEILSILSSTRQVPNPVAQGTVGRAEWRASDLANQLLQINHDTGPSLLVYVQMLASGDPTNQLNVLAATFMAALNHLPSLELSNPLVMGGFQMFLAAGIITQEQFGLLTQVPDSDWPAYVTEQSPLERIGFPSGSLLGVLEYQTAVS